MSMRTPAVLILLCDLATALWLLILTEPAAPPDPDPGAGDGWN